jgi:hypothetical protein
MDRWVLGHAAVHQQARAEGHGRGEAEEPGVGQAGGQDHAAEVRAQEVAGVHGGEHQVGVEAPVRRFGQHEEGRLQKRQGDAHAGAERGRREEERQRRFDQGVRAVASGKDAERRDQGPTLVDPVEKAAAQDPHGDGRPRRHGEEKARVGQAQTRPVILHEKEKQGGAEKGQQARAEHQRHVPVFQGQGDGSRPRPGPPRPGGGFGRPPGVGAQGDEQRQGRQGHERDPGVGLAGVGHEAQQEFHERGHDGEGQHGGQRKDAEAPAARGRRDEVHEQRRGRRNQGHEGRAVKDPQADQGRRVPGQAVAEQGQGGHDQARAHDRQGVAGTQPGADERAQDQGGHGFEGQDPAGPEG